MHLKWIVLLLMVASPALSQVDGKTDVATAEEKALFARRQATMLALSKSYTGVRLSDSEELSPIEEPLQRWSNPLLGIEHGVLVGWKDRAGRPMAVAQVYQWPTNRRWLMEHQSLCVSAMEFRSRGNPTWRPKSPGIKWTKLSTKVPKSVRLERLQLAQLKTISRRFRAQDTNTSDKKPRELRLLATPSMEYSVPKDGILKGALFAFVSGTDPDVLLMVELRKEDGNEGASFYWALAPMSTGKLLGFLDKTQVWQHHGQDYKPTDTFYPHSLPSVRDVMVPGSSKG